MDIIIKSCLKRFKEQYGLSKIKDELAFEKFCVYSILQNELSFTLENEELDEICLDQNKGIDAICLAINNDPVTNMQQLEDLIKKKRSFDVTLYFFQVKTSPKFKDSEILNFCDSVIDFLSEKPAYPLTKKAREYHNFFLEIINHLSYLKTFNCKLFYCTTGTWNEKGISVATLEKKRDQIIATRIFKSDKGEKVEVIAVDKDKLRRLYDKTIEPLNAEFNLLTSIPLKNINNVEEAYLGIIQFKELMKIIVNVETGKLRPLYHDNVRDYLGLENIKVNEDINKTLENKDFALFQLLNNGITVVAEDNRGRQDKFILINSQVVNGCQTSNVLFKNKDLIGIDELKVPIKLIITKDSDIRDKIIVSTNNQTAIKEEQLLALTEFQKRLEQFYKAMPDHLYYERRKAQYANDPNIKKSQIVDIREQIKAYVAMFLEEPHVVSGYFAKVYKDRKGSIFHQDHICESYYVSALIQNRFKQLLVSKKIERKYNKARYHLFMLFRKIAQPSKKFIPEDKQATEYCNSILEIIRDEKRCLDNFQKVFELVKKARIDINNQKEIYKKTTTKKLIREFEEKYGKNN